MAHYAEIDEDGYVIRVIVVGNGDCIKSSVKLSSPTLDVKSISGSKAEIGLAKQIVEWEDETIGAEFCKNLLGGEWVRTSYNGNTRNCFAGIGYYYDKILDVFIPPRPYKSWELDKTGKWQPPTPKPDGENIYFWNEAKLNWVLFEGRK